MKTSVLLRLLLVALIAVNIRCIRIGIAPGEETDSYTFSRSDFDLPFIVLGSDYDVPASMRTLLMLNSKAPSEHEPTTIAAVYVGDTSRISTDTVILYCHGQNYNIDYYWPRVRLLTNLNGKFRYGVMMMDYRGYGLSKGSTTEETLRPDVEACINWLKEHGLKNGKLILYGYSLGTYPALSLAADPGSVEASKVILESPFASAEEFLQDASAMSLSGSFITNLHLNNVDLIKRVEQPLLWLHGKEDDFISYQNQGELLFDNYKGRYKERVIVDRADHLDVPFQLSFKKYCDTLARFITRD